MQSTSNERHPSVLRFRKALPALAVIALALAACGTTDAPAAPLLSSTSPAAGATGVALNATVTGVFDQAMTPLTSTTFTLKQGATAVAATVSTSADGKTATLKPSSALAASTVYTAALTSGATAISGVAFAGQSWTFTTGGAAAVAPLLSTTAPASGATGVPLTTTVSATFDQAMAPLTGTTFTVKQGTTAVPGALTASSDAKTTTFTPSSSLASSTVYTATITAGAKSAAGVNLAADRTWSFTTAAAVDTTPPTVLLTAPAASATGVATNASFTATFSEAIDALSLTTTTFSVKQGSTVVAGAVSHASSTTATFTPSAALAPATVYTATLSTGIKDLAGNALTAAFSWSFTTSATAALGPAPVLLGTAGNYVILAQTGISTVPTSAITGDIGLSPAAASFITGFSLVADATNVFSTATQITGKAYAADYAVPTPTNLTTAVSDMQTAYTDAAGRVNPDFLELATGNLSGRTLVPGLYKWTTTVTIPGDVTISGGANDVWIFQTTQDLTMSAAKNVILAGGAQAKNIFWQVAGQATFGAGAHFEGILLSKTTATLQTGASMNGRLLVQTQAALQSATLTKP